MSRAPYYEYVLPERICTKLLFFVTLIHSSQFILLKSQDTAKWSPVLFVMVQSVSYFWQGVFVVVHIRVRLIQWVFDLTRKAFCIQGLFFKCLKFLVMDKIKLKY